MHFSTQLNSWSPKCSWSCADRNFSNYIFMRDLTPGVNILRKDNCKTRRGTNTFWDSVHLMIDLTVYTNSHTLIRPSYVLWWFISSQFLPNLLSWLHWHLGKCTTATVTRELSGGTMTKKVTTLWNSLIHTFSRKIKNKILTTLNRQWACDCVAVNPVRLGDACKRQ